MIARALVALLVTGCDDPRCEREDVVGPYIAGHALTDCGDLPGELLAPPDLGPWHAAHDCVLAELAAQRPFIVRWSSPGIEGASVNAMASLDGVLPVAMFSRGYQTDGSLVPTKTFDCDVLLDFGRCSDAHRTLCLHCPRPRLVETCGE